jgi:hypothetical protein
MKCGIPNEVRPDYAISVDGAITGYVEVKRPGHAIDPNKFRGHDLHQWARQRDLPNLVYTNGTAWRLWRDGVQVGDEVVLSGGELGVADRRLAASSSFEGLLTEFLRWAPAPITSVGALVRAVAPLTRLLRGEVLDQIQGIGVRVTFDGFPLCCCKPRAIPTPGRRASAIARLYAQLCTRVQDLVQGARDDWADGQG